MTAEMPRRPAAPPRSPDQPKRSGAFNSLVRLITILLLIAGVGTAVVYWPRLKAHLTALSQVAMPERTPKSPEPQATAIPTPSVSETAERLPESAKEPAQAAQPSIPLPTTFGVYALSEGQLHELRPVPGKIPDRRVAISAAINTPSATTLMDGDVKFIVFRPDGGVDASGTEVRVIAKVSRSMGVDATGKAAMVSAGDSWVIRSMSYPYKVGPIDDQSRMLLLQPEQDGFTLAPGRYVVVVKGMGYDFTVAGTITDPNQCVERINAANGAFYSPCPPPRRQRSLCLLFGRLVVLGRGRRHIVDLAVVGHALLEVFALVLARSLGAPGRGVADLPGWKGLGHGGVACARHFGSDGRSRRRRGQRQSTCQSNQRPHIFDRHRCAPSIREWLPNHIKKDRSTKRQTSANCHAIEPPSRY